MKPFTVAMAVAVVVGVVYLFASMAFAVTQKYCWGLGYLAPKLAAKYGEQFAGSGVTNQKAAWRLYVSPKGTFTLSRVDLENKTECIKAAGADWSFRPLENSNHLGDPT